jgi:RNA polymerase sigma factor (TIGR02999 family)
MSPDSEVTRILSAVRAGGVESAQELYAVVYAELRRLAGARMLRERNDHTLQPTALVHEAFLRLVGQEADWESRAHFFGAAANAMRRILVEHARARGAANRGGERERVSLGGLEPPEDARLEELVAVHVALEKLEVVEPRKARVVALRYFAGLSVEEVASALQVSRQTVMLDWSYARAWLFRELRSA